ncbi:MAG: O-antigen ligase family protein [bacterium]
MSLRKVEKFFLGATLFSMPLGTGAFFDGVMSADLVLIVDIWMTCLYLVWIYRTNLFSTIRFRMGGLAVFGLLMVVWSIFSMSSAIALHASGVGIYFALKSFFLYLYLVNNIRTKSDLMFVVNMVLLSLLVQGVIGTMQKVMGRTLGLGFLGERQISMHKIDSRARGTLAYPNRYGAVLILLLPLAISMAMFVKRSLYKLLLIAISGFGIMALFLSLSRSSWAGFLISMVIFVILLFRRGKLKPKFFVSIGAVMIAAAIIAAANWDTIMYRFEHGADGRFRSRMIDIAIPIIKSHPFLGVGLNNYQWHSFDDFNFWHPVHNEFLRFAAELGIPGAILFTALLLVFLREAYRNSLVKDSFINAVAIGVFCGLISFIVAINIGPEYQHYRIKLVFWALAGITFSLRRIKILELKMAKRKKQMMEQRGMMREPIPNVARAPNGQIASPEHGMRRT